MHMEDDLKWIWGRGAQAKKDPKQGGRVSAQRPPPFDAPLHRKPRVLFLSFYNVMSLI